MKFLFNEKLNKPFARRNVSPLILPSILSEVGQADRRLRLQVLPLCCGPSPLSRPAKEFSSRALMTGYGCLHLLCVLPIAQPIMSTNTKRKSLYQTN